MNDPNQLLISYARNGDETAFSKLVSLYVDFVYSVGLRCLAGHADLAQDAVQMVFSDLAKKASTLPEEIKLGGWLHRHTCFVSSNLLRTERRRQVREQQSITMNKTDPCEQGAIAIINMEIDQAVNRLDERDREAVILRFFEQRNYGEMARTLGVTESGARKRVNRALDKLRGHLPMGRDLVTSTALLSFLSNQAVSAAPAGLVFSVCSQIFKWNVMQCIFSGWIHWNRSVVAQIGAGAAFLVISGLVLSNLGSSESGHAGLNENVDVDNRADMILPFSANDSNVSLNYSVTPPNSSHLAAPTTVLPNQLELELVSKATGLPLMGVEIVTNERENNHRSVRHYASDQEGLVRIPFVLDWMTDLEVKAHLEFYADTTLRWFPGRGESIPPHYMIEMEDAVPVGGLVLNSIGEPIADARVSVAHSYELETSLGPENHEFGSISVTTDSNGRWEINRIAADMLPLLRGSASHPDYLSDSKRSLFLESGNIDHTIQHLFTLHKGVTVSGTVLNPSGDPVGGAHILAGMVGEAQRRETVSEPDGSFVLKNVSPEETLLTGNVQGYAATTIPVSPGKSSAGIELMLETSRTVRVKVLDPQNQAVPGAKLTLNTPVPTRTELRSQIPRPQVEFSQATDHEGRMEWREAPKRELHFSVHAPGFMGIHDVVVPLGDTEHLIRLIPILVVQGTLQHASTLKSIDRFIVDVGWPTIMSGGKEGVAWSNLPHDRLRFAGGVFRHEFRSSVVVDRRNLNPGYILRFRADGFEPFVTRRIGPEEKLATFTIMLNPSTP